MTNITDQTQVDVYQVSPSNAPSVVQPSVASFPQRFNPQQVPIPASTTVQVNYVFRL